MPTPKRGPRLGSNPGHQRLMMAGLAMELFRHGRITTTEAKARELRPYAEKMITKAKRGDLAARRQVLQKITDRDVVAHLFEEIGPRFADRPGGYTRMLKLGPRAGDAAPMALVELVEQARVSGEESIEEAKKERGRGIFGRRRRKEAPPEPAFAFDDDDHDHDHDEDVDLDGDLADDEDTGPEPDVEDEHEDALEDPAETDPDVEAVEPESKSPTEPTTG